MQDGSNLTSTFSRRSLLAAAALPILPRWTSETQKQTRASDPDALIARIRDPEIRAGVGDAIRKNLLRAATQTAYPGYFNITADGSSFGDDATWPGLDSWQMAGAYLLLGFTQLVLDYFEFVRASQHPDGNIPFAIFRGGTQPGSEFLRGLDPKTGTFTYSPPDRSGVPDSARQTRTWVGLFHHWESRSDPLSVLGPICYVLTAAEIHAHVREKSWLLDRLPSIEAAAAFVARRIAANGLVAGSGFYIELPPRWGYDGVTQCYAHDAFLNLADLYRSVGQHQDSQRWLQKAASLKEAFIREFWRADHFGEYVHVERGLVDAHGLSDTNWAAVAFGLADGAPLSVLWPKLMAEKAFWWGGLPTQVVTRPFSYEPWEDDPVPFSIPGTHNDVAAMGRVWFLEATACRRMREHKRLQEAARLVSGAAVEGFWRERYHPQPDGSVQPSGALKYCEYPAILIRVVLGNPSLFSE